MFFIVNMGFLMDKKLKKTKWEGKEQFCHLEHFNPVEEKSNNHSQVVVGKWHN